MFGTARSKEGSPSPVKDIGKRQNYMPLSIQSTNFDFSNIERNQTGFIPTTVTNQRYKAFSPLNTVSRNPQPFQIDRATPLAVNEVGRGITPVNLNRTMSPG